MSATETTQPLSPSRFLKLNEIMKISGLSKSAIYLQMGKGTFPSSVNIGPRSVAWLEADIQHWITQRISERETMPGFYPNKSKNT